MEEGSAAGALSLVTDNCGSFGIYVGVPARFIKKRKRGLLEREKGLLSWSASKTTNGFQ
jgi:galactoside O-acetyltransferase